VSLNAGFDSDPEGYDRIRRCWLNQRRTLFVIERLREYGIGPGAAVLELGSGTGWLLRELAQAFPEVRFCGLEPLDAYVAYASERTPAPNVRFVCSRAENAAACLDEKFQVILSNDVLHHVESVTHVCGSAAGVAEPGCYWLAMEPNPLNPYVRCSQFLKRGERNFDLREFARAAAASGWHVGSREYLFLVPPFFREAPEWLQELERRLEGFPLLGGGVCLESVYGYAFPGITSNTTWEA